MNKSEIEELSNGFVKKLVGNNVEFGVRLKNISYMSKKNTVVVAITQYSNGIINMHFGNHFQVLSREDKISIIKHECCHVADITINGVAKILEQDKTAHGETFDKLCDVIGCKHKRSIIHNPVCLKNAKSKSTEQFIVEKGEKIW